MMNYRARDRISNWTAIILLGLLLVIMVGPLLMVVLNSFKTEAERIAFLFELYEKQAVPLDVKAAAAKKTTRSKGPSKVAVA